MLLGHSLANNFQFFACDSAVVTRVVAIPVPPEHTPDHTKSAENEKRHSPTGESQDCDNERRRESTSKPGAHEKHAVSIPDLASGKPSRETPRNRRKRPRFAYAE